MANYKLAYTGEQVNTAIGNALNGGGGGGTQLYLHKMTLNNKEFVTISKDPGKYDGNAICVIINDCIKATYDNCIILNYYNTEEAFTIKFDYVSNGTINSITVNEFTSITDTVTPL